MHTWTSTDEPLVLAGPANPGLASAVAGELGVACAPSEFSVAVVHKLRRSATSVTSAGITGDVRGRSCIIVDDMITTGGTVEGAALALRDAGASWSVVLAATHDVLTDTAWERLARVGVEELVVTDSVLVPQSDVVTTRVVSVAELLAAQLGRLTDERRPHAEHAFGSG